MFELVIAGFVARTRAPFKFFPRTKSRTGFTECLAHHDGGSTFVTDGNPLCGTAPTSTKEALMNSSKPMALLKKLSDLTSVRI